MAFLNKLQDERLAAFLTFGEDSCVSHLSILADLCHCRLNFFCSANKPQTIDQVVFSSMYDPR